MEFFTSAATDKLPLFDGDIWIEVKTELTAGDMKKLALSALKHARSTRDADGESQAVFDVDVEGAAFAKVALWLVDWNVPGRDGKPVDISNAKRKFDALKALRPSVYDEIERAIDAHAAQREEKKAPQS